MSCSYRNTTITLTSTQIPEPFRGLLSPVKVVQDAIEERTENKVSLLEGRASVTLNPDNPSLSNGVDISSANDFMALSDSYFKGYQRMKKTYR